MKERVKGHIEHEVKNRIPGVKRIKGRKGEGERRGKDLQKFHVRNTVMRNNSV